MPHSDTPDAQSFKIRDGLGVLGCLVIGAVIIGLGSKAGIVSLTAVSSLFLGAAGQLATIVAILWLARRRGVRIGELVIGQNAWWREAVLGVVGAIVLWAIAIGLWLAGLIPISDRLSLLILGTPQGQRTLTCFPGKDFR